MYTKYWQTHEAQNVGPFYPTTSRFLDTRVLNIEKFGNAPNGPRITLNT